MRFRNVLAGVVLFLVVFSSCERYRCIKGNGDIFTDEVTLDEFTQIKSMVSFDIIVEQDTVSQVIVQADENLIPYIQTDVIGSELLITTANDRCLRSRNEIRVYVKTPDVDRIILQGSGDLLVGNLNTRNLKVENDGSGLISFSNLYVDDVLLDVLGSGDIIITRTDALTIDALIGGSGNIELLRGTGDYGIYTNEGSGDILADGLRLLECEITIDGSGDILVWATDHLYGDIYGSGAVFYYGWPAKGIHINNGTEENVLPL